MVDDASEEGKLEIDETRGRSNATKGSIYLAEKRPSKSFKSPAGSGGKKTARKDKAGLFFD